MSKKKQTKNGICYLVGAGPGDPDLLTLKAKNCIENATVILHDELISPNVLKWTKRNCEIINVGKRSGNHKFTQSEICKLIVSKTLDGNVVVRLKGGDPMIFGRISEELKALNKANLKYEIVPGVNSVSAASAYACLPLTDRNHNSALIFYSGHSADFKENDLPDLDWISKANATKVIFMGLKNLEFIVKKIIQNGSKEDLPVAVIQNASTGKQKIIIGTLKNIVKLVTENKISSPALTIIGEAIAEKNNYKNWFGNKILSGKTIVVTRTREQVSGISASLRSLGAEVIELPVMKISATDDPEIFTSVVEDAHTYNWIIFSSPNGVDAFFTKFYEKYSDARELGSARIAAIGPSTAKKIKDYRFKTDVVPDSNFTAEGLVSALNEESSLDNLTVLWVRPEKARRVIFNELNRHGAIVDEAIAYKSVIEDNINQFALEKIEKDGVDLITFASSLTAEFFFSLPIKLPKTTKVASIGPITSKTLEKLDRPPDMVAKNATIQSLIESICKFYQK